MVGRVTRTATAAVLVVAGVPALGSQSAAARAPATPAAVVRAWSAALDRDDNQAAANLFARNAVVVQNGLRLVLLNHHLAVLWNSGLPCTGRIVKLEVTGDIADATFVLGNRKSSKCDAPGIEARAAFKVRKGKIVLWVQLPVEKAKSTKPKITA